MSDPDEFSPGQFAKDVAAAFGFNENQVLIESVVPGSLIVTCVIQPFLKRAEKADVWPRITVLEKNGFFTNPGDKLETFNKAFGGVTVESYDSPPLREDEGTIKEKATEATKETASAMVGVASAAGVVAFLVIGGFIMWRRYVRRVRNKQQAEKGAIQTA